MTSENKAIQNKSAELLMLCGVLNDTAELSKEKKTIERIKIAQEKLERIVTESINQSIKS